MVSSVLEILEFPALQPFQSKLPFTLGLENSAWSSHFLHVSAPKLVQKATCGWIREIPSCSGHPAALLLTFPVTHVERSPRIPRSHVWLLLASPSLPFIWPVTFSASCGPSIVHWGSVSRVCLALSPMMKTPGVGVRYQIFGSQLPHFHRTQDNYLNSNLSLKVSTFVICLLYLMYNII